MKSQQYKISGVSVISLGDAITQTECDELRRLICDANAEGNGTVVLDMTEVPFVDSAGLETLCELTKEQTRQGHALRLASLSENCSEILRLTDLRTRFEVFATVEEASRSLA